MAAPSVIKTSWLSVDTLCIQFSEALDENSVPALSSIFVYDGSCSRGAPPQHLTVSGDSLIVGLAPESAARLRTLSGGSTGTIEYKSWASTDTPLRSAEGTKASGFTASTSGAALPAGGSAFLSRSLFQTGGAPLSAALASCLAQVVPASGSLVLTCDFGVFNAGNSGATLSNGGRTATLSGTAENLRAALRKLSLQTDASAAAKVVSGAVLAGTLTAKTASGVQKIRVFADDGPAACVSVGNSRWLYANGMTAAQASELASKRILSASSFYDAEKRLGTGDAADSQMCWAGAASNMLAFAGYAKAANGLEAEDAAFAAFRAGYGDAGGRVSLGVLWYLDGADGYYANLTAGSRPSGAAVNAAVSGRQGIGNGARSISAVVSGPSGIQNVWSGGLASAADLRGAGRQQVLSGGRASATRISSGGTQLVQPGGFAAGGAVLAGGLARIHSGGTASGAVLSGGLQRIENSGTAVGTVVSKGGRLDVLKGGLGSNTHIRAGGTATAIGGSGNAGTLRGAAVSSGGSMYIAAYGLASGGKILAGGKATVQSGGTAANAVIAGAGAVLYVLSGGTASACAASSSGKIILSAGGVLPVAKIWSNAQLHVCSGAAVTGEVINAGGQEFVSSGGTATKTAVIGIHRIWGTANSARLLSGGTQAVSGLALRTTVSAGGLLIVCASGKVSATTVLSGGSCRVSKAATAAGDTVSAGGSQSVAGTATGAKLLAGASAMPGGVQDVRIGGTASGTVVNSCAQLSVQSGGKAAGAHAKAGGLIELSAGAAGTGLVVSAGGSEVVHSGAADTNAKVAGVQTVEAGGSALGVQLAGASGMQTVYGYVSGTKLNADSGQWLDVCAGATASGCTATGSDHSWNGRIAVSSGGKVIGTVVSGGLITANGTVSGTKLLANGSLWIGISGLGGEASGTVAAGGGGETVSSGARSVGAVLSSGGSQIVFGGAASSAKILAGGIQRVQDGGRALNCSVAAGGSADVAVTGAGTGFRVAGALTNGGAVSSSFIESGGSIMLRGSAASAFRTTVSTGGKLYVSSGIAVSATVLSGGNAVAFDGGRVSALILKAGASAQLTNASICGAGNSFTGAFVWAGGSSITLAAGGKLALESEGAMSGVDMSIASGAALTVKGSGTVLKNLDIAAGAAVCFDVSAVPASGSRLMLSLKTQNAQKQGTFSINVQKRQAVGTQELANGIVQDSSTAWTMKLGGTVLGKVTAGGSALKKNGMAYALKTSGTQIQLVCSANGGNGNMRKGTADADTLTGNGNCDVFWGGKGNDTINPGNGRDVAVYDKTAWGADTIKAATGTLTVLFKDLAQSSVASSLSGSVMTFSRTDASGQKITVSGWNAATHNVVFGTSMSAFGAWVSAASPTAAQTSAARLEVWRKAALA